MSSLRHSAGALTALVVLATGLVLASGTARAEGYAHDLAGELMSPFCPGRTVASCPSPQAAELIQWIQVQEAAGATEEEVVEMLIERFGEEILGAPPAEGITLWAYVFPVLGFVVGGGVAFVVLRRLAGRSDNTGQATRQATRQATGQAAGQALAVKAVGETGVDVGETSPEGAAWVSDEELERLVDAELAARR